MKATRQVYVETEDKARVVDEDIEVDKTVLEKLQ